MTVDSSDGPAAFAGANSSEMRSGEANKKRLSLRDMLQLPKQFPLQLTEQ